MEGISETILLPSKIGSQHYVLFSMDDLIELTCFILQFGLAFINFKGKMSLGKLVTGVLGTSWNAPKHSKWRDYDQRQTYNWESPLAQPF